MSLRNWSLGRVMLVAALLAFLGLLVSVGRSFYFMWGAGAGGGLAGVSFDVFSLLLWVMVPPIVLFAAWLALRR
jgi:hypothetical protein